MSAELVAGVDVGGTKVLVGLVAPDGTIVAQGRRDTPHGDAETLATEIAEVIDELDGDPVAVGLGIAGWIDVDGARVLFAPNLSWADADIKQTVTRATGLPTVVENDANAAAWGELIFGAARGETEVVVIAVGTGLGGGLIMDGRLQRGGFGIAGEPGHITLVQGGRLCPCGRHGCWEQYSSGNALVREAREVCAESPRRAGTLLDLCNGDLSTLTGPMVTTAAQAGDPISLEAMEIVGRWLGSGLATVATLLDPRLFVIGGGAGEAGELLLEPARAAFQRELPGIGHRPVAKIVSAELGNTAGLVGAAELARAALHRS